MFKKYCSITNHYNEDFKKYCSITNHYNEKDISRWFRFFPELITEEYVIQEKIHGSNIQFIFVPHEDFKVASRTQLIPFDDGFFTVKSVFESQWKDGFEKIKEYSDNNNIVVRVYGELFGPKVQKGVKYGDKRRILLFDVEFDGKLISQKEMEDFLSELDCEHLMVPILDYTPDLESALNFDTVIDSTLTDVNDGSNIMEGVVIKPYNKVFQDVNGSTFYIKKKNEEFKEKSREKTQKDPTEGHTPEVVEWRDTFRQYLNNNRVLSVTSKYGDIEQMSDFGKYIGLITEDAKKTFLSEEENFDEIKFNKKELRFIFNGGKVIAELLKEHMKGN